MFVDRIIQIGSSARVFAIYNFKMSQSDKDDSGEVSTILLDDGLFVWSADKSSFGPPFFATYLPLNTLSNLISHFSDIGLFEQPGLTEQYLGSGAPWSIIKIRYDSESLSMISWHESSEYASPKITCNQHGQLVGWQEKRLELLRNSEPSYIFFRLVWSILRQFASDLKTPNGFPIHCELCFDYACDIDVATCKLFKDTP